jgi:hypothetical protein
MTSPAQVSAAAVAIRKAAFGAACEHGATAMMRGLADVLIECLIAAYGESEAQATMRGFAEDVLQTAATWRLVEEQPAGRA